MSYIDVFNEFLSPHVVASLFMTFITPTPVISAHPDANSFSKSATHLPNLNGIRFIAAFLVLIHHIEQVKWMMKVPNVYPFYLIKNSGKLGVGMFFVLSGFLITYLLLREREYSGTVSVPNFYARRVLRIWPLYLLIVLLSTFVFPQFPSLFDYRSADPSLGAYLVPRLTLLLLVMPNMAIDFFGTSYLCSPAWSIGVEEQFYILWPHIMRTKKWSKKIRAIVFYGLGIAAIVGICALWYLQVTPSTEAKPVWSILLVVLGQFRISLMLIGAAGATLLYYRHSFTQWLFSPITQLVGYSVMLAMWLTGFQAPGCNLEVYGLFFALLIINVAGNPNTLVRLDNWVFESLGRISYGIYLYHIPIIVVLINLLELIVPANSGIKFNSLLYTSSISLTILVSYLSYKYFETPFLRLKDSQFAADKTALVNTLPIESPVNTLSEN